MTFYEWCIKNEQKTMLQEWDCEKNLNTPKSVSYGSIKNVFWKCKQGHSWESSPNKRTAKGGSNCPYCVNKKVWKGYNDLASINPNIVQEWDYEKNELFPTEVLEHSNKLVYWKCKKGTTIKQGLVTGQKGMQRGVPIVPI